MFRRLSDLVSVDAVYRNRTTEAPYYYYLVGNTSSGPELLFRFDSTGNYDVQEFNNSNGYNTVPQGIQEY